jgi:hypothetical protein
MANPTLIVEIEVRGKEINVLMSDGEFHSLFGNDSRIDVNKHLGLTIDESFDLWREQLGIKEA